MKGSRLKGAFMLSFVFVVTGCSEETDMSELIKRGDKYFKSESNKEFSGVALVRTGNGDIMERISIDDGSLDGPYESWHYNKNQNVSGHFSDGLKDGKWEYWEEDGSLSLVESYDNGEPDGTWIEYRGGQKKKLLTYQDGEKDGPYESYYTNGQLAEGGEYSEGRRSGRWVTYTTNGILKSDVGFKDGEYDGRVALYTNDGRLDIAYEYENREIVGFEDRIFKGSRNIAANVKDGKYVGKLVISDLIESTKDNEEPEFRYAGSCEYDNGELVAYEVQPENGKKVSGEIYMLENQRMLKKGSTFYGFDYEDSEDRFEIVEYVEGFSIQQPRVYMVARLDNGSDNQLEVIDYSITEAFHMAFQLCDSAGTPRSRTGLRRIEPY